MKKGWFCRYWLSTVSNLADVSVRCTGLLQGEDALVCCFLLQSGELHDKLRPLLESARKVLRSMKKSHAVRL